MKKYSHNHPAVQAWTPELQRIKDRNNKAKRRETVREIAQRVETLIGMSYILFSFPTIAWLSENNAPVIITVGSWSAMIGLGVAILMEDKR